MNRGVCIFLLGLCPLLPIPVHADVTDVQVKEVARELACLCGDCPRRPLDECACDWADRNRQRISDALEAGRDKDAVVAEFIREFGHEALSAPPTEGFHLTAWVMPVVALIAGGFVVRSVVSKGSRGRAKPGAQPQSGLDETSYRERLEDELRKFDE